MTGFEIYIDKIKKYLLEVDNNLQITTSEEPLFNRFSGNMFDVETGCMPGGIMLVLITTKSREGNVEIEGTDFNLFVDVFKIML